MKTLTKLAIFATLLAMSAGAFAQGRGFGRFGGNMGGPERLLNRKDVAADLKLTDDQQSKIKDLRAKERADMDAQRANSSASGDFSAMREAMKKVSDSYKPQFDAILTPEQQTRLKQIDLQLRKNRVLEDEDVQNQLGLTDDQRAKIKDLQDKMNEANQGLFEKVRDGSISREDAMASARKNNDTLNDELGKILTPDQQSKLTAMEGAPFTATDPEPQFGGRGGGGGF